MGAKERTVLTVLFLFVFLTQVHFAYQTDEFSSESYHNLRHIDHLRSNFVPLYNDDLSYQGRQYYYPPLFHYFVAIASYAMGLTAAAKVIPPFLFSITIFLVYGIALKITRDKKYAFFSAFFFSFSPITYLFPINNLSPLNLAIPILFGIVYLMMAFQEERQLSLLLVLIVALVFTHPSAFILLLGLMLYLSLLKLEGMKVDKKSTEIVIFTMFMVFWALFIIYKNVFLTYGFKAVWQNVPKELLASTFPSFTFLNAIYLLGAIPLLLGAIGAYQATFNRPNRHIMLLLGFTLAIFAALWLNFIRLEISMLFLSTLLAILSAQGLKARVDYMDKTKLYKYKHTSLYVVVFFFVLSSMLPLYVSAQNTVDDIPSEQDIKAMKWLRRNTPENTVILAPIKQGHEITYFANRKNVIDTAFLLIPDVNERLKDVNRIFKVHLESEAIRLLNKYEVDLLFYGEEAKKIYGSDEIYYVKNKKCFTKIYDHNVTIYKVHCTLGRE